MPGSFSVAPKRWCRGREGKTTQRRLTPFPIITLILWGLTACNANDPLSRRIKQLNDPSSREQAIDALVKTVSQTSKKKKKQAVQSRVVDALCEAYRADINRNEIVGALAFLRAPRAKHIFIAALRDAARGGTYREAAIRSAQIIGELKLSSETPALLDALKSARSAPPGERGNWLERAIINALIHLGDTRAIPSLIEIIQSPPELQDFYLNKLAAQALGRLADKRGITPLIDALTRGAHGLLLYETSRRSLCMIGPAAAEELLAKVAERHRDRKHYTTAVAAVRVLGDLGLPEVTESLQLTGQDNAEYRLALAESLLRLGDPRGEAIPLSLIQDKDQTLTVRQRAAALLGWYGSAGIDDALLAKVCATSSPGQNVLCWGVALAYTRVARKGGEHSALYQLIETRTDQATQHYLQAYRVRLAMMEQCGEELACLAKKLTADDWRVQERAALALGRQARKRPPAEQTKVGTLLARAYREAHPQVREAILVGMERLVFSPKTRAKMVEMLRGAKTSFDPAIESRALCLSRRLMRIPGEK